MRQFLHKCQETSDIRLLTKDQISFLDVFWLKALLMLYEIDGSFLNNLDLFYSELSYMTELRALMPKSAECDKIFLKCQNCISVMVKL